MRQVSSWGRLTASLHEVVNLTNPFDTSKLISGNNRGIAYGNGRSYGDVCLNPDGLLWHTIGLDHFYEFDNINGRITCEAGVLL